MAKKKKRPDLLDQIREAIQQSGQTLTQLEGACGVDRGSLSRFVRSKRILGGDALEKICSALGLRLTGGPLSRRTPPPQQP